MTRITPTRIRTLPFTVSAFVTTTTPARIRFLPFTVSGIEQYTCRLLNIVLLKNYYLHDWTTKTEKSVSKITFTIYKKCLKMYYII